MPQLVSAVEKRIQPRRRLPLVPRQQVPVGVVGRAYVGVADVGLDLLGVQAGGDEVAGAGVAGFVGREWGQQLAGVDLAAQLARTLLHPLVEDSPRSERPAPRGGAHERLGRRPAKHEIAIATAGAELVRGQLVPKPAGERDDAAAGVALDVDLAFHVVP